MKHMYYRGALLPKVTAFQLLLVPNNEGALKRL